MSEKRRTVRGRYFTTGGVPHAAAAMDIGLNRATHQLGFRLVAEDPDTLAPRFGSMYYDLPEDACVTYSRKTRIVLATPSIGFRLALEKGEP